jgi:electron transfer flavoprotein beta subunit
MSLSIVVLIKQIPDMNGIRLDRTTGVPQLSGQLAISSFDECALEAALRLKEQIDASITVISVGPASVKDAITRALAMGADQGVHILLPATESEKLDSLATAGLLAAQMARFPFDLILTGQASDDFGSGQIGPQVAELLGIPQVGSIASFRIDGEMAFVERDTEDGRQQIEATLPILLMAQVGLNEPRYPSLKGIMAAKKKPLEVVETSAVAFQNRVSWSEPYSTPRESSGVLLRDVAPAEAAKKLVEWLRERKLV